jgi:hypothetical protein
MAFKQSVLINKLAAREMIKSEYVHRSVKG